MTLEAIDYSAVLADLQQKRAKIDAAISGIEVMLGMAPSPTTGGDAAPNTGGVIRDTLRADSFFGMTAIDAAVKYLRIVKCPKTSADIAAALKDGGFMTTSQAFNSTVNTALAREAARDGGEVVKIKRGEWALREWYKGLRKNAGKAKDNGSPNDDALDAQDDGIDDDTLIAPEAEPEADQS